MVEYYFSHLSFFALEHPQAQDYLHLLAVVVLAFVLAFAN